MKRIVLAAATAALVVGVAGTASAQSKQVEITGAVASKCGIKALSSTVPLNGDLTDANAKVRSGLADDIATALNGAGIIAFCNQGGSKVNVERAVLTRTGAQGTGLVNEFAQYIGYHLDASIGSQPLDSTLTQGSSDVVARFGGHDSQGSTSTHLKFAASTGWGAATGVSDGSNATAIDWTRRTDRRLAAGTYTGYVNVTLTPGA